MDPADADALHNAIRDRHGVESAWLESVRVTEIYQGGEIIWQGDVQVFQLEGHPTAPRAYAWSDATESSEAEFVVVLHAGRVIDAETAVRTWTERRPRRGVPS